MKKRGQLTIFIILGIVLLFAFGFLFFVRNVFFEAKIEEQTQEKLQNVFRSESFKTYTSSCLDEVSKDAVLLIGKQGGNIYEEQGGIMQKEKIMPIQDKNKNISVSYGITWNPLEPDFFPPGSFTTLPEYPRQINIFLQTYFGNNNLPYLCQPEGPNQETQGDIKRETCTFLDPFVKPGYGPDSIQEQLSLYIADKLDDCINLTDIPGLGEIVVEEGNYDVEVIFGKEDVMINAKIPLVVSIEGETLTQKAEFSSIVDVRLKKVYELAHAIVENDRKWLSFDKKSENFTKKLEALGKLQPGFNIDLSCPFCSYGDFVGFNFDDLIKITDAKSKIGKENFIFMFVIENRFPALEKISYFNPFNESPLSGYDIIIGHDNKKILIEPEGFDPDEDNVSYLYNGWREDFYTEFDLECCKGYGGTEDCRVNYSACITIKDDLPSEDWTTSDEYKENKRDASVITRLIDIGLHNVTVRVKDEGNLSDWQDISILIVDSPLAVGSSFNNYSTIENSKASIEDPYYLNATASVSIILQLAEYNWYDKTDPFSFEHLGEPILRLPYELFNISNIKGKNFKAATATGLNHEINLSVSNKILTSDETSFNVSVYKCLPYRDSDTAPWPYNNLGIDAYDSYADIEDPFLADHTCCKDDYNYEDTSKKCYEHNEYSIYYYFKENLLTNSYLPDTSSITQTYDGVSGGYQNDIFKREFKRYCSGDRGNICNGTGTIEVTRAAQCNDICERPAGQDFSYLAENRYPTQPSCVSLGDNHYITLSGDGFSTYTGRCDPNYHSINIHVECKYGCGGGTCSKNVDCRCKDSNLCFAANWCFVAGYLDSSCRKCVPRGDHYGSWVYYSEHCSNGQQDSQCGETGVDCGGECEPCPVICGAIGGTLCIGSIYGSPPQTGSCSDYGKTSLGATDDCLVDCCR